MVMAGLDGIANRTDPGDPLDKNLYDLPPEEASAIPQVCGSLEEALKALEDDHAFLTQGGVFSEDFIGSYCALKREELTRVNATPHPVEFSLYYSL